MKNIFRNILNHKIIVSVFILFIALFNIQIATAQGNNTIIIETVTENGTILERQIQYEPRTSTKAANSFQDADQNYDNCVDAREAYDSGILNFNQYSANKKCLTETEFMNAMQGQ